MTLRVAVGTELLKARRSRVPWGVAAGFSLAPLVMGLFMIILKDPERARALGLLGAKAQLTAGTADWPTFLNLLGQAVAVGGAILFAFLTAWVFGREFADRTIRGILAIPTPRRTIIAAKSIVIAAWALAISTWVLALGLVIGALVGLPGWAAGDAGGSIAAIALAAVLTIGLQTWAACFAGVGRGYIAPWSSPTRPEPSSTSTLRSSGSVGTRAMRSSVGTPGSSGAACRARRSTPPCGGRLRPATRSSRT
jgi:ABC-2 type transport system permease protein